VDPVTTEWTEGNGKSYGLSNNQKFAGTGSGTTWFSPTDDNISNNSSNSVVQWNGGATYVAQGTAPSVVMTNHQTGELRFDVTEDVLNGASDGWLLRKDAENKGSKVSFYSKEGAAAAGNSDLGPRLILNYGSSTAWYEGWVSTLASRLGLRTYLGARSQTLSLRAEPREIERSSLKTRLRASPASACAVGQLIAIPLAANPMVELGAHLVYRSWLSETPALV
jgi:hypothetical protein